MTTLLLVGCGKMGGALFARWTQTHPAGLKHFAIIDPVTKPLHSPIVEIVSDISTLPENIHPAVIVFAVKPQNLGALLPLYAQRFGEKPLYLSIAAGKSLAFFESHLGAKTPIVRAMPNTPAQIGEGITVLCANASVSETQKKTAETLMRAVGKTLWVDDERLMNAVTAISGSGPAYVFLFMEVLARAAQASSIPEKMAVELVRQTVRGSAMLAESEAFETLRKNVTSPGGTTEAALAALLKDQRFEALLKEAVQAAIQRAGALEK